MFEAKSRIQDLLLGKLVILGLAGGLIFLLFDNLIMPLYTNHGESLELPDVTKRDTVFAFEMLESLALVAVVEDSQYSETIPAGTVLLQRPPEKARIKEGRRVYLTYSRGKRPLFMPDFTATGLRNARLQIGQMGLEIAHVDYRYSSNILKGTVSGQSIPPGDPIRPGQFIDLTVSKGPSPDKLIVPDVVNRPLKIAITRLAMVGLEVDSIIYVEVSNSLPDIVVEQSISAGKKLLPEDRIILTVSRSN
jgi:beta-lactam-binding protein with PASTA domain